MIKKDKNGIELNLGDKVKIGELEFEIKDFKLRSYGWVACQDNGNAYECAYVEKLFEEPPTEDKKPERFF